jgi:hypothetical protein
MSTTQLPDGLKPGEVRISDQPDERGWYTVEAQMTTKTKAYRLNADHLVNLAQQAAKHPQLKARVAGKPTMARQRREGSGGRSTNPDAKSA